ncbi:His Kinase A (phospho-acceptor) domain-containing protein [Dethiosulfatibacter aminovorans DSM 17477]|uniref:histidine kinase n=1 Tax=Dethiosulfatibacter aminovorans DSM 17477 TaxID=1121476 RepID=A0A1M6EFP7_9FIRM|nr:ATP-binding protein [Dethiosulfatibacter aminovorans]SHI84285.1 His Kinase A (phospho-acceptor) domain-containing protein [Dethiosulfatibacter aminovorans DSM 17477]
MFRRKTYIRVNCEGFIDSVNHGAEIFWGFDKSKLLNRHYMDLFKDPESLVGNIELSLKSGMFERKDVPCMDPMNMEFNADVKAIKLDAENSFYTFLSLEKVGLPDGFNDEIDNIFIDSLLKDAAKADTRGEMETAIARLREELKDATSQLVHTERMTALGELTSSIAHELNQPLNNMKLVSQDILRDIKKERLDLETLPSSMGIIVEQIGRMAEIIDHMRIFTRKIDSEMPMEKIQIEVPFNNIFLLIGQQLKVHDIDVLKDLAKGLPCVFANSVALEQVFTNILINARSAVENYRSHDRSIKVKTFMEGQEVGISIENNGGKIPDEIREKIFEPFFTTKDPGEGTGLGLSISSRIVKEHGGRIILESEDDWTRFTVLLPAAI